MAEIRSRRSQIFNCLTNISACKKVAKKFSSNSYYTMQTRWFSKSHWSQYSLQLFPWSLNQSNRSNHGKSEIKKKKTFFVLSAGRIYNIKSILRGMYIDNKFCHPLTNIARHYHFTFVIKESRNPSLVLSSRKQNNNPYLLFLPFSRTHTHTLLFNRFLALSHQMIILSLKHTHARIQPVERESK